MKKIDLDKTYSLYKIIHKWIETPDYSIWMTISDALEWYDDQSSIIEVEYIGEAYISEYILSNT